MYFLVFPAWEPDSNDVLCAKFLYFYRPRCFNPKIDDIQEKIIGEKGAKRLQGAKIKHVIVCNRYIFLKSDFFCSHMSWTGTGTGRMFTVF